MIKLEESGFTLTEMIVAVTVSSIVIGVLFSMSLNSIIKLRRTEIVTEMALESQAFLSQTVEDLRLAGSIATNNAISDSNAPVGGWVTSDADNILVINSPATDSNRDIIYDSSTGYPYYNEYIYYISSVSLYKRILKNDLASGNAAVTTCPPPTATPACPADKLFSNKVNNISMTFYDSDNALTAIVTETQSLVMQVDMSKQVTGDDLTLSNSAQVTLRN